MPKTKKPSPFVGESITIVFDRLPTSVNSMYGATGAKNGDGMEFNEARGVYEEKSRNGGDRYLRRDASTWKKAATILTRQARNEAGLYPGQWAKCPLRAEIDFYVPTSHYYRRDLDGFLKLCIDAVMAGLELDDRRIIDLHPRKRRGNSEKVVFTLSVVPEFEIIT